MANNTPEELEGMLRNTSARLSEYGALMRAYVSRVEGVFHGLADDLPRATELRVSVQEDGSGLKAQFYAESDKDQLITSWEQQLGWMEEEILPLAKKVEETQTEKERFEGNFLYSLVVSFAVGFTAPLLLPLYLSDSPEPPEVRLERLNQEHAELKNRIDTVCEYGGWPTEGEERIVTPPFPLIATVRSDMTSPSGLLIQTHRYDIREDAEFAEQVVGQLAERLAAELKVRKVPVVQESSLSYLNGPQRLEGILFL